MWREEKQEPGHDPAQPIRRSPSCDGGDNVLHTEKGEVPCRCPATGVERPMAFQGFEVDRGTLKYRCPPVAAYGLECAGRRGVPARRRLEGRRPRASGARRSRGARPADVHTDAVGQPVVAARLRAARHAGADKRATGQRLRVRAPLRARSGEDDGAAGARAGGDDGLGARFGGGGRPERMRSLVDPGPRPCALRTNENGSHAERPSAARHTRNDRPRPASRRCGVAPA